MRFTSGQMSANSIEILTLEKYNMSCGEPIQFMHQESNNENAGRTHADRTPRAKYDRSTFNEEDRSLMRLARLQRECFDAEYDTCKAD